jgi:hypothetical protein
MIAGFTAAERDYTRRNLDQFFSTLPTVANGFLLKTWRSPQAGQPKVPLAAKVAGRAGKGPSRRVGRTRGWTATGCGTTDPGRVARLTHASTRSERHTLRGCGMKSPQKLHWTNAVVAGVEGYPTVQREWLFCRSVLNAATMVISG